MRAKLKSLEPVFGLSLDRLPSLGVSLIVAERFFKFHSFTLECLAFLALWRGLDALQHAFSGWGRH
jgi:hypothetical protein